MVNVNLAMGYVYLRTGRSALAEESIKKGIELGEELLRLWPKYYGYRIQLGIAYATMATMHIGKKQMPEAQKFAHQAMEIFDGMEADGLALSAQMSFVNDLRPLAMFFQVQGGDYSKAISAAEKLAAKTPPSGAMAYNLACIYALAGAAAAKDEQLSTGERVRLADEYGRKAMELLHKSRDRYLNSRRALLHMQQDSDLASLRSRPDYQRLVQELERQYPAEEKQPPRSAPSI
jgi:tetratricopeptide (TPR) repeat protein